MNPENSLESPDENHRRALCALALGVDWTVEKFSAFRETLGADLQTWWEREQPCERSLRGLSKKEQKQLARLHGRGYGPTIEEVQSWPGQVLLYGDENYPTRLCRMKRPPVALHVRGEMSLLEQGGIAVVGSRKIGVRAARAARAILEPLVRKGGVVISGGALGADAVAHRAAVDISGLSIAVLPGGVDRPTPRSNAGLFEELLLTGGCLLSEYPPGQEVRKYHFRRRNEIIAALSSGVFVLRAAERSGTMLTVEAARQQKKPLAAMPGEPDDALSQGCHEILRGGGRLIATGKDLLRWWTEIADQDTPIVTPNQATPGAAHFAGCVVLEKAAELLESDGSFSLEALVRATEKSVMELQSLLLAHELSGLVERAGGGERYRLTT